MATSSFKQITEHIERITKENEELKKKLEELSKADETKIVEEKRKQEEEKRKQEEEKRKQEYISKMQDDIIKNVAGFNNTEKFLIEYFGQIDLHFYVRVWSRVNSYNGIILKLAKQSKELAKRLFCAPFDMINELKELLTFDEMMDAVLSNKFPIIATHDAKTLEFYQIIFDECIKISIEQKRNIPLLEVYKQTPKNIAKLFWNKLGYNYREFMKDNRKEIAIQIVQKEYDKEIVKLFFDHNSETSVEYAFVMLHFPQSHELCSELHPITASLIAQKLELNKAPIEEQRNFLKKVRALKRDFIIYNGFNINLINDDSIVDFSNQVKDKASRIKELYETQD